MAKTIKIGEAALGEGGLVSGGQPGDQTGSEVRIVEKQDITKRGYSILIRPKSADLAEKSAKACELACANPNIGYSQQGKNNRNTLYKEAKKVNFNLSKDVLTTPCNTDCSAFLSVCVIAGGSKLDYEEPGYNGNGPATTTMKPRFSKTEEFEIIERSSDSKYFTSSDYLQRGDILVKPGAHTIMILANGSKISTSVSPKPNPTPTPSPTPQVKDYFAIKLSVDMSNISNNGASAKVNISKIIDNKEEDISDLLKSNLFNWKYNLSSITNSSIKPKSDTIEVKSSKTEFSLKNLEANNYYKLKIIAAEKDSDVEFSSPDIVFMTARELENNDYKLKFIDEQITKDSCKTFIRIKDSFKPVILYNNKREE